MKNVFFLFTIVTTFLSTCMTVLLVACIKQSVWSDIESLIGFEQEEENVATFPASGYQLPPVAGTEAFTAGPYSAGTVLTLPVGQVQAEAIMDRFPYLYNATLPDHCDERWFEV